MTDSSRIVNTTCLCGSAAHEISLPSSDFPLKAYFCHCDSCRHMSGTLSVTIAFLRSSYNPPQASIDKLKPFVFSKRITYYFCPTCGTHVYARLVDDQGTISWAVPSGILEKVDGVYEVEGHEWIGDTLDGGLSDLLPVIDGKRVRRWPGHFKQGKELPLYWHSPDQPAGTHLKEERLRARCLCGGVEFWISKPTDQSALGQPLLPEEPLPGTPQSEADGYAFWLREDGTKYMVAICPCNSCRLACGMEWAQWAYVPPMNITLDAAGTQPFPEESRTWGSLKQYYSSSGKRRHFCGVCGATVFIDSNNRLELLSVAVGLFSAPEGARAEDWLHWRIVTTSYFSDTVGRAECLAQAMKDGIKAYGDHRQGNASN